MSDWKAKAIGTMNDLLADMTARAEAAEKALAEMRHKQDNEADEWNRCIESLHDSQAERDVLRAELEKMKSDRDQFADEADDLRAEVNRLQAQLDVEGRQSGEIAELRAQLARQHEGVKGWMRDYTDAATEADELRAKLAAAEDVRSAAKELIADGKHYDLLTKGIDLLSMQKQRDAALARAEAAEAKLLRDPHGNPETESYWQREWAFTKSQHDAALARELLAQQRDLDMQETIEGLEAKLAAAEARKHVRGLCGEKDCDLCEISQERLNAENQRDEALADLEELRTRSVDDEQVMQRDLDAALARVAYVEEQDQKLVGKFHEAVDRTNAAEARVRAAEEFIVDLRAQHQVRVAALEEALRQAEESLRVQW